MIFSRKSAKMVSMEAGLSSLFPPNAVHLFVPGIFRRGGWIDIRINKAHIEAELK